jgi:hydroxymethylpyrimidine/phosphomethylpyrimidine kinase
MPPAAFVAEQIAMVFADIDVAAIKIGMLGSPEIVEAVASALADHADVPIVLDPVLVATSGAVLGSDAVVDAMRRHLFPMATIVTPNLAESGRLAAMPVPGDHAAMTAIATHLYASGPAAWLIKGGHGEGASADDVLFDGVTTQWFSAPRIDTRNTHGTGCTLSSAIAAFLAMGLPLADAVGDAKAYLTAALAGADRLRVGTGHGPVDHFAAWRTGA